MKDQLNITIRIADQPSIPMTIRRSEEELIRRAESTVNKLWNTWSERYNTSPQELMTMIAFQFAKLYVTNKQALDDAMADLKAMDNELENLLRQGEAASHPFTDDDLVG
ncbi:MAG: cell division protein ZapA [Muribaculaceae bacterium]|nr:cell division protein ZapA [Muribaculaceae bacterium]